MKQAYFIQKEAVYYHGVVWIGYNEEEGMTIADETAKKDRDSHHDYVLYEYSGRQEEADKDNFPHVEVYRSNKGDFLTLEGISDGRREETHE